MLLPERRWLLGLRLVRPRNSDLVATDLNMRLSPHFTLLEMVRSATAMRLGIDNTPGDMVVDELRLLCREIMEPLRHIIGVPIVVTSGYRCPQLNMAIGGAARSQHMLGQACDWEVPGVSNRKLMDRIIRSGLPYDQLIYEFGEDGWIHISRATDPRMQVLRAESLAGRTVYLPYL